MATEGFSPLQKDVAAKTVQNLQTKAAGVISNVADSVKNMTKNETVRDGSSKLRKKLEKLYEWFIAPLAGAKDPRTINFYNFPPVFVELISWYRPKVTAGVAILSFYLYFLIAWNEYSGLGLLTTLLYLSLIFFIVIRQLMPFFGMDTKTKLDLLPKAKVERWTKEIVEASEKHLAAFSSIIECEAFAFLCLLLVWGFFNQVYAKDYAKTLLALFVLYIVSVVANQVSDMFVVFLALVFVFTCPYFIIQRQKQLDDALKGVSAEIHKTFQRLFDAIPKADLKDV